MKHADASHLRVCLVVYDMQEFGGLEEYVVNLAIGLQQLGYTVSLLSTAWVPPANQYLQRMRQHAIPMIELPKWLSLAASDWAAKERILQTALVLLSPLVYLLGLGHFIVRRAAWNQSIRSARHWLQGQLMQRWIGPDRRRTITCLLLEWWRLRWRPDVLDLQGYTSNLLFVVDWASHRRLPVVYEEHQTPDSQFDWWGESFRKSVNKASVVVAVSDASAQALQAVCGITRPIVTRPPLLPDPVALGWHRNGGSAASAEALSITTVARLYVTKGLTYLLEAIARTQAVYPATEFRVYGDGPLRQDLLDRARALGLDGNRIFVGAFTDREQLARIMADTDIFVMSSVLEGQPLSLVEAMAYGCPIVATSVGGIPELIEDGVNGLLCAPADSTGLANAIATLIENPSLRASLGRAARRSYETSSFQPASVANRLASIYRQALATPMP